MTDPTPLVIKTTGKTKLLLNINNLVQKLHFTYNGGLKPPKLFHFNQWRASVVTDMSPTECQTTQTFTTDWNSAGLLWRTFSSQMICAPVNKWRKCKTPVYVIFEHRCSQLFVHICFCHYFGEAHNSQCCIIQQTMPVQLAYRHWF